MGTINTNKSAAKHCVIFCKHQDEMPLDILGKFIEWTEEKILKAILKLVRCYIRHQKKRTDC